ncbi:MAG: Fur family transcriptional regulator [Thermoguttaceae bacterium]
MLTSEQISKKKEAFRECLFSHHLVLTPQREVVYGAILKTIIHPTADQLLGLIRKKKPKFSRMSVFRTLELFADLRIIRAIEYPGSATRYDANMEEHHHLICQKCQSIFDFFPEKPLFSDSTPPFFPINGFVITDVLLMFRGICKYCSEQ